MLTREASVYLDIQFDSISRNHKFHDHSSSFSISMFVLLSYLVLDQVLMEKNCLGAGQVSECCKVLSFQTDTLADLILAIQVLITLMISLCENYMIFPEYLFFGNVHNLVLYCFIK